MEDMIPTSVTLPPTLKERAEKVAHEQDRTLSSLMRLALWQYLEALEKYPMPDEKAPCNG